MSTLPKIRAPRQPIPENPTIRRLKPGVFEIEGRSATYAMIDGACSCPSACYRTHLPAKDRCWHYNAILAWSKAHPVLTEGPRTIEGSHAALEVVCREAAEKNDALRATLPAPAQPAEINDTKIPKSPTLPLEYVEIVEEADARWAAFEAEIEALEEDSAFIWGH